MAGEWEETTLGECAQWFSGGTPFKGNKAFWSGPIPWVSAKDMKSFRLHDAEDHISPIAVGNGAKLVPAGTILLLVRGMTLHNDVPICMVTREMAFNQDIKALRPSKNVDGAFLAYWLLANKPDLLASVDHAGHGTGRLVTDTLKEMPVQLPPLAKQKAIASVLGALDDKIELNRRMNETLEAMARAIFQDWFATFGPTRAKMEGRPPYLAPDLWSLFPDRLDAEGKPEGWREAPLDQIADFLNGLALQKYPGTGKDDLPVIKIAELRAGVATGSDRAARSIPQQYVVEDGDVLFSWSGSLLQRVWTGGRGALNQHLFKVTSKEWPKWMHYLWVNHHLPSFQAIAASKATTMGHIQRYHLSEAITVIGSPGVMAAADALIGPLLERCLANSLEAQTLTATRDLLLPRLMSGEIRVKDAERINETAA